MRLTPLRWWLAGAPALALACGSESVLEPDLMVPLTSVAAGIQHSCGLSEDGTAYCWGWNRNGQIGDGTTTDKSVAVAVDTDQRFASIVAGGGHSCGLTAAGAAYCWGLNLSGQLGDGTVTDRTTPAAVAGGLTFSALYAGGAYTCGITTANAAYCWGWNEHGQLGDGSGATEQREPTAVAGGIAFASLAVETRHTCGLDIAGAAYCWGRNVDGQLGDGTNDQRLTPVAVAGGLTWSQLGIGENHSCGLVTTGEGYCWGGNDFGETALPGGNVNAPMEIIGGLQFEFLDASAEYSCAVSLGVAYCWGSNDLGQHGSISVTTCNETDLTGQVIQVIACAGSPVAADTELRFDHLDLGSHHVCGITIGAVAGYCWGSGIRGQLGNGQTGESYFTVTPQRVMGQPAG